MTQEIDQNELLEAMEKITARIKKKYKFLIYDGDDIAQQAWIIILKDDKKLLNAYKRECGPLYNFLSVAINNRIINFIRDMKNQDIEAFNAKDLNEECQEEENQFATSIDNDIKLQNSLIEENDGLSNDSMSNNEFWDIVDDNLSSEYRSDYLKLRQGIDIPKLRKANLIVELKRIANEHV